MTPSQQAALESVAGRELTTDEATQIDAWLPTRRDDLITDLLSAGRTKYVEARKVEIGIIGAYPGGPLEADALLAKLEAHAAAGQPLSRLVGRALKAMAVEPGTMWAPVWLAPEPDAIAVVDSQHGGLIDL